MAEAQATTEANKSKKVPVTMKDGRTLEFTERQKAKTADILNGTKVVGIQFDFKSGDSVRILEEDITALFERFMWHGVEQKFRDEFASADDAEDAFTGVEDLLARIKKGEWSEAREGGLGGITVLVKALMSVYSKSKDEVLGVLRELSAKEKTALRQAPGIKEEIQRLEAEKGKGVDISGALAKFGAPQAAAPQ